MKNGDRLHENHTQEILFLATTLNLYLLVVQPLFLFTVPGVPGLSEYVSKVFSYVHIETVPALVTADQLGQNQVLLKLITMKKIYLLPRVVSLMTCSSLQREANSSSLVCTLSVRSKEERYCSMDIRKSLNLTKLWNA